MNCTIIRKLANRWRLLYELFVSVHADNPKMVILQTLWMYTFKCMYLTVEMLHTRKSTGKKFTQINTQS